LFYNYKDTQELENIIKSDFSLQNEINYEIDENVQSSEVNENSESFESKEELKQLEYKKIEGIELKNSQAENQSEDQENLGENEIEDEKENQEFGKRFCVIVNSEDFMIKTENLDESNIKELNIQIEVPENVVFLQDSTKKERKNAKNIFLEYLPIEKKIKLKKLLEDREKIFSDYSVNEIL